MVKRSIKTIIGVELIILCSMFISLSIFTNLQVSFLSSFFIIIGSSFAYKKMVKSKVQNEQYSEDRDLLNTIEDPHELYDETPINDASVDELDLKAIVKEERSKIKTFSLSSIKHGVRGSVSLLRLVPYLFLILGFIALQNNSFLMLQYYLPGLLFGIIVASLVSKEFLIVK